MSDVKELLERAADVDDADVATLFEGARVRSRTLRARRRASRLVGGLVACSVVVVVAIAVARTSGSGDHVRVESVPTTVALVPTYSASGTVLQSPYHGPKLCLGPMTLSIPPQQCSGIPLKGWDWAKVAGEQSTGGSTWGMYRVSGPYDGTTFTVVSVRPFIAGHNTDLAPLPDVSTPCPPPPGGWRIVDSSKVKLEDYQRLQGAIAAPADYAASWMSPFDNSGPQPLNDVINVQYTGNLEQHRAELANIWGGPICVTQGRTTAKQLRAIAEELHGAVGNQLGLDVVAAGPDDRAATIHVTVVVATEEMQRAVDAHYGKGRVILEGELKEVP